MSGAPALPHRAIGIFNVLRDQCFVAQIGVEKSLSQRPAHVEQPLPIVAEFLCGADVFLRSVSDEFAQADASHQAEADAAGVGRSL